MRHWQFPSIEYPSAKKISRVLCPSNETSIDIIVDTSDDTINYNITVEQVEHEIRDDLDVQSLALSREFLQPNILSAIYQHVWPLIGLKVKFFLSLYPIVPVTSICPSKTLVYMVSFYWYA